MSCKALSAFGCRHSASRVNCSSHALLEADLCCTSKPSHQDASYRFFGAPPKALIVESWQPACVQTFSHPSNYARKLIAFGPVLGNDARNTQTANIRAFTRELR